MMGGVPPSLTHSGVPPPAIRLTDSLLCSMLGGMPLLLTAVCLLPLQAGKLTDSLLSGFNVFAKELDSHVTPHLHTAADSLSRSVSNLFAQTAAVVGAAGQAAAEQGQSQSQSSTRLSLGGAVAPGADAATSAGIWVPPPPPPPPPAGHVGVFVFDPSSTTAAATPAPPPGGQGSGLRDSWSAEVNEKV